MIPVHVTWQLALLQCYVEVLAQPIFSFPPFIAGVISGMDDPDPEDEEVDKIHEDMFVTSLHSGSKGAPGTSKSSAGHVYQPPCFQEREAYQSLLQEGLIRMPDVSGFQISHHSQTRQWHARRAETESNKAKNFAPSWGEKRSETMALLLVVRKIWEWCPGFGHAVIFQTLGLPNVEVN